MTEILLGVVVVLLAAILWRVESGFRSLHPVPVMEPVLEPVLEPVPKPIPALLGHDHPATLEELVAVATSDQYKHLDASQKLFLARQLAAQATHRKG